MPVARHIATGVATVRQVAGLYLVAKPCSYCHGAHPRDAHTDLVAARAQVDAAARAGEVLSVRLWQQVVRKLEAEASP